MGVVIAEGNKTLLKWTNTHTHNFGTFGACMQFIRNYRFFVVVEEWIWIEVEIWSSCVAVFCFCFFEMQVGVGNWVLEEVNIYRERVREKEGNERKHALLQDYLRLIADQIRYWDVYIFVRHSGNVCCYLHYLFLCFSCC